MQDRSRPRGPRGVSGDYDDEESDDKPAPSRARRIALGKVCITQC